MLRAAAAGTAASARSHRVDLVDPCVSHQILGCSEEMHRVIEYPWIAPAAGLHPVQPPRARGRVDMQFMLRAPVPRAVPLPYLQGPPNCTVFNQFAGLHVGGEKNVRLANQQLDARPSYRLHRGHPLGHAAAEGFLAMDVFAGLRRLCSHLRVQIGRRGDVDYVQIVASASSST